MASPSPVEAKRKYFTIDEANRALPLVRAIVTDIVEQWKVVAELESRLKNLGPRERKRQSQSTDPYSEELAQTQAEFERQEAKLRGYVDELERLGVELKGSDG